MGNKEYIRDFNGNILGIIETETNGDQTAYNFPGMLVLGRYKKQFDHTTNFNGVVVARGNTVAALIYEDIAKRSR